MENVAAGRLTIEQAAELLGRSSRQVKRLKQKFDADNIDWVYHGNRGRKPANVTAAAVRKRVIQLARGKYAGFNDHHMQEKLVEQENLRLRRQSVRRILRRAGIASPQKRRARKYRSRRERRSQEGMLLLIDGSRHDWLEGRGPYLTLLGVVDDATSKAPAARFQEEHEDTAGYLRLLRSLVEGSGVPLSLYRDQHGTLQRNDKHWSLEEQLAGRQLPTQVGRALEEMGISTITALSPQAKGRIERAWRTFQDRLVSELRLARATTLPQASTVLARFCADYNQRFARPAADSACDFRPVPRRFDLARCLALHYQRIVSADHTVTLGTHAIVLP